MENNDLKKIWAVELDLLEKLKEICKKYELNYCASSGTLLGAARHKGFIPWDDDIDVFLMWPDYKKLMDVAANECSYPYCFQSIYSEIDAMPSACRLRRSDTTGFTMWEHNNVRPEYDRGIFIDIFPLFYVPDSEEDRKKQKESVIYYWEAIRGYDALNQKKRGGYVNPDYERCIPTYMHYCESLVQKEVDVVKIKEQYLEACAWPVKSKEVGATSSKCHLPSLMWETEWYSDYVELPFENTTIACPKEYDLVLSKQYGDWRTPVRGGAKHEMAAIDTDISWQDYQKQHRTTKEE